MNAPHGPPCCPSNTWLKAMHRGHLRLARGGQFIFQGILDRLCNFHLISWSDESYQLPLECSWATDQLNEQGHGAGQLTTFPPCISLFICHVNHMFWGCHGSIVVEEQKWVGNYQLQFRQTWIHYHLELSLPFVQLYLNFDNQAVSTQRIRRELDTRRCLLGCHKI